jgi:hypothetical protein
MTGWRIGQILSLRWEDVSLDKGTALTRAEDNKGRRDALVPLHPVIVDHLRKIIDFGRLVFAWPRHRRTLWEDFHAIQEAAGIAPEAVLRVPRPAEGLRVEQRRTAPSGRSANAHAAPQLRDHPAVHQHGPTPRHGGGGLGGPRGVAEAELSVYRVSAGRAARTAPRGPAASHCGALCWGRVAEGTRTLDPWIHSPAL